MNKITQWLNPTLLLDADDGKGGGGEEDPDVIDETTEDEDDLSDFEQWLEGQDAAVKAQYAAHIDGLKSALSKERANAREVKALKKRVKEFEDAQKAQERDEMSELEQAKTDLANAQQASEALQQQLRDTIITTAISLEAVAQNFHDPDDAIQFVDTSELDVEDQDALQKAIRKQLKAIAEKKSYLIKSETPGDNLGTPPRRKKSETPTRKTKEPVKTGIRF